MTRNRWLRVIVCAFSAWYLFGALAAFGSAVLWQHRISQEGHLPGAFLREGLFAGLVAILAMLSTTRRGGESKLLWWTSIAIAGMEIVSGALRSGFSSSVFVEMALVAVVFCGSLFLSRSSKVVGA
jgi:hypothetical protein